MRIQENDADPTQTIRIRPEANCCKVFVNIKELISEVHMYHVCVTFSCEGKMHFFSFSEFGGIVIFPYLTMGLLEFQRSSWRPASIQGSIRSFMDQDPHSCCTLDPDPAGVSDLKKKKKTLPVLPRMRVSKINLQISDVLNNNFCVDFY